MCKRPIIGITCDYDWKDERTQLYRGYHEAVEEAGGIPLLIPVIKTANIPLILDSLDGLLLSGGQDMDPSFFGEEPHPRLGSINPERDRLEIELCRQAVVRNMPILGICRGIQVLNVAMGGDIYQDMESQFKDGELCCHFQDAPKWHGIHRVWFEPGSLIHDIMGRDSARVNSFHHQAVRKTAPMFHITGKCHDGIIEVIESVMHSFVLGVQWHPERMWQRDQSMFRLFKALVDKSVKG